MRWSTAADEHVLCFVVLCAGSCSECLEAEVSRPGSCGRRGRTEVGSTVQCCTAYVGVCVCVCVVCVCVCFLRTHACARVCVESVDTGAVHCGMVTGFDRQQGRLPGAYTYPCVCITVEDCCTLVHRYPR